MIYTFSDCVLNLDRRTLLREGVAQHIEPQVFDLLVLLVQAEGRTVTKDEIIAQIWDGRAISDDAITSRIKSARKAIGDDGRSQRFIRTLPKIGYRFDGHVDAPSGDPQQPAPNPGDETSAPEIGYVTDRKGRSIGYAVHGDGPLLIVPPFWVTASDLWHDYPDIQEFFLTLGKGLRILRYDRPGSGLSRDAYPNETLEDEVALLEDMVAAFRADSFSLLAISAAGPVAIRYAVAHPKKVDRICFYGAYGSGEDLAPPESQAMLLALIRQHWGVGSRALADIFVPSADAEDRRRFAAQQRAAADSEQAAAMLELSWQIDAKLDTPKVDVPTLVLHRQEDRAVPVDHGQWLARSIPGARLQLFPGDAHAPWFGPIDVALQANSFLLG
ncbi:winged helix-turn-helix domain-containing protein [Ruegeria sp. 2205SS24-7]|uniref:alpha/beta fold hydrolase n=1 Tax=Ruegeria discodermiae TaxID=3064389 RepID=UPI00274295CD|nr:alpha/beta fold hydrolase [Ruegeria sp. 2205SS24-7]MDP5219031.1 winged helix-turn-helix domain-containing protein [Ruegeria sp. 2205SS24-7]